jgi:hypothetical protein
MLKLLLQPFVVNKLHKVQFQALTPGKPDQVTALSRATQCKPFP